MKHRSAEVAAQVEGFLSDPTGVAATEYAVLLALIVLAALGSIVGIGVAVEGSFTAAYQQILRVLVTYAFEP